MNLFQARYAKSDIANALKYVAPTAFAVIVSDHLNRGKGFSAVRMGDGERAILEARSKGTDILYSEKWKERYGLSAQGDSISIPVLAENLVYAGNNATYFGPNIAGLWRSSYLLYKYFVARPFYIDALYAHYWFYGGFVRHFLISGKGRVFVICREHRKIVSLLNEIYLLEGLISGVEFSSWKDWDAAREAAVKSDANIVLVAGGPVGKSLVVRIAEQAKTKAVLDVGSALMSFWCRRK